MINWRKVFTIAGLGVLLFGLVFVVFSICIVSWYAFRIGVMALCMGGMCLVGIAVASEIIKERGKVIDFYRGG